MNEAALQSVLGALLASVDSDNRVSLEAASTIPEVIQAREAIQDNDSERFYFALMYPLSQVVDGLLSAELPDSDSARFLFKHSEFVERNLSGIFSKFEGRACSADKASTVIRSLLRFFREGREISFDRTQQYTYHLPKMVLCEHAEIVAFFQALHALYYGQADAYIACMAAMSARAPGTIETIPK
jgi:hypothetical protein